MEGRALASAATPGLTRVKRGMGEWEWINFPNNIHRANYYFILSKKPKKPDNTNVLSFGRIVRYKNLLWKGVSCVVLLV
jgi:hypothetical protein